MEGKKERKGWGGEQSESRQDFQGYFGCRKLLNVCRFLGLACLQIRGIAFDAWGEVMLKPLISMLILYELATAMSSILSMSRVKGS